MSASGGRVLRSMSRLATLHPERLDPVQEALLAERCILVDERDRAVGEASKRDCHVVDEATGRSPLHRAFSLFVFNERDELLMQKRSLAKITFPGLWTNTCCSHPLADLADEKEAAGGAGVKVAAQRRLQAELGVSPDQCPVNRITFLTRILYSARSGNSKWGEHELDYILLLRGHMDIAPNPNEVMDTAYVRRNELSEFLAEAARENGGVSGVTPWFDLIAKHYLPMWWDDLDNVEAHADQINIKKFT